MSIASKQAGKKANEASEKVKVSGVILVDKPKGMTSQQVVSKVKYLFKSPIHDSKKAGHTGTLDPMATGLLPICLGEATSIAIINSMLTSLIKQPSCWVAKPILAMLMGKLSHKRLFQNLMMLY